MKHKWGCWGKFLVSSKLQEKSVYIIILKNFLIFFTPKFIRDTFLIFFLCRYFRYLGKSLKNICFKRKIFFYTAYLFCVICKNLNPRTPTSRPQPIHNSTSTFIIISVLCSKMIQQKSDKKWVDLWEKSVKWFLCSLTLKLPKKESQRKAGSTLMEFSTSTQLKFWESQWHNEPATRF